MGTSRRDEILAMRCVTATDVAGAEGLSGEDLLAWVKTKLARSELFGVWSAEAQTFVFPDFQFSGVATAQDRRELFQVLSTCVGFDPILEDRAGWARAYWLFQPNTMLSEAALAIRNIDLTDPVAAAMALAKFSDTPRSPADLFGESPNEVIAAAKHLAECQS